MSHISRVSTWLVYISIILFGLSSWIVVNGVYSQLPLFVKKLPEKWAIASQMSVALQLSNVFPIIHLVITTAFISSANRIHFDTVSIYIICVVGIISTIFLGLFWDRTVYTNNSEHSLWFLFFVFLSGAVDCTTSVVYFAFISNYRYLFSSALTIGEGLTGGVVGVLSLIQQPGSNKPLFNVLVFCIVLSAITFVSLCAFTFLRFSTFGKSQLRSHQCEDYESSLIQHKDLNINQPITSHKWKLTWTYRLVLTQSLISFFDNAVINSILPYVFKKNPRGDILMQYAISIGQILDPVFCLLAYVVPVHRQVENLFVSLLHLTWVSICTFLTVMAMPWAPYKRDLTMGIILTVLKITSKCIISYCKTKEFLMCHQKLEAIDKRRSQEELTKESRAGNIILCGFEMGTFRLAGLGIQLSALVGSLIMLALTTMGAF
ncbi:hypothetical protein AKO1_014404 [Acrasis kona]|uniref:Uncharacterized protein n=1 Tax=Acrasis kona TaxID=1008807 RepID=A0AAW2Z1M8_9EUKA